MAFLRNILAKMRQGSRFQGSSKRSATEAIRPVLPDYVFQHLRASSKYHSANHLMSRSMVSERAVEQVGEVSTASLSRQYAQQEQPFPWRCSTAFSGDKQDITMLNSRRYGSS